MNPNDHLGLGGKQRRRLPQASNPETSDKDLSTDELAQSGFMIRDDSEWPSIESADAPAPGRGFALPGSGSSGIRDSSSSMGASAQRADDDSGGLRRPAASRSGMASHRSPRYASPQSSIRHRQTGPSSESPEFMTTSSRPSFGGLITMPPRYKKTTAPPGGGFGGLAGQPSVASSSGGELSRGAGAAGRGSSVGVMGRSPDRAAILGGAPGASYQIHQRQIHQGMAASGYGGSSGMGTQGREREEMAIASGYERSRGGMPPPRSATGPPAGVGGSSAPVPVHRSLDKFVPTNSIRMISEALDWNETISEFLSDGNNQFLVIGVIGEQGAGKSTVASFLAGNLPSDPYRNYLFRPETKEAVETNQHQTVGVNFYVSPERNIILDAQPIMSPSVLHSLIQLDKRYSHDYGSPQNCAAIQSLEIVSFMLQVCHVIVLVSDWFLDANSIRFLLTAEMLKPTLSLTEAMLCPDYYPHFVYVLNKAEREEFEVPCLQERCSVLRSLLRKSKLRCDGLCSPKSVLAMEPKLIDIPEVNYFVLPEVNFWLKHKYPEKEGYKGHPELDKLVNFLRLQLLSCPRTHMTPNVTSERSWYMYAARVWESVRQSLLISEYGRFLS